MEICLPPPDVIVISWWCILQEKTVVTCNRFAEIVCEMQCQETKFDDEALVFIKRENLNTFWFVLPIECSKTAPSVDHQFGGGYWRLMLRH